MSSDLSAITTIGFALGGPTDIAIIAVVVLVLFGGSKLATLGKSMGEGIREFKKATKDDDAPADNVPVVTAKDEEKQQ